MDIRYRKSVKSQVDKIISYMYDFQLISFLISTTLSHGYDGIMFISRFVNKITQTNKSHFS